jgi:hypothetical protein
MRAGYIAGFTFIALAAPASAAGPQLTPGYYAPQRVACAKAPWGEVTTFFPDLGHTPSLGFGAYTPSLCEARRLSSRRFRVGCGRLRDTTEAHPYPDLFWTTVDVLSPTRYRASTGRERIIFRWCGARDTDVGGG